MAKTVVAQIDFGALFKVVASKVVPLLGSFKNPQIIQRLINYLTRLLELTTRQSEVLVECFRHLNIQNLMHLEKQFIEEAIIDLLKELSSYCPESGVILEIALQFLAHKLTVSY